MLRDGPVTSGLRATLALSLAEQGRYEEAEAEARWVFARSPNLGRHVLLAWVLIAEHRAEAKAMAAPRRTERRTN